MSNILLEKLQELVEAEVQRQLAKYAQVISKKHDISLKLLLQDIPTYNNETSVSDTAKSGQCLGITAAKHQCKSSGKHGGYCMRHKDQKKVVLQKVPSVEELDPNRHIGHTIKECMFLASCPACEKSRIRGNSRQNLLIDI